MISDVHSSALLSVLLHQMEESRQGTFFWVKMLCHGVMQGKAACTSKVLFVCVCVCVGWKCYSVQYGPLLTRWFHDLLHVLFSLSKINEGEQDGLSRVIFVLITRVYLLSGWHIINTCCVVSHVHNDNKPPICSASSGHKWQLLQRWQCERYFMQANSARMIPVLSFTISWSMKSSNRASCEGFAMEGILCNRC